MLQKRLFCGKSRTLLREKKAFLSFSLLRSKGPEKAKIAFFFFFRMKTCIAYVGKGEEEEAKINSCLHLLSYISEKRKKIQSLARHDECAKLQRRFPRRGNDNFRKKINPRRINGPFLSAYVWDMYFFAYLLPSNNYFLHYSRDDAHHKMFYYCRIFFGVLSLSRIIILSA